MMKAFRREAHVSNNVEDDQLLENIQAFTEEGEVKRGAILFFAKHPEDLFFHAVVRCTQFKGTDKLHIIDDKTFGGPLVFQYEQALNWIEDKLTVAYEIKGTGPRTEKWEMPLDVFREALINVEDLNNLAMYLVSNFCNRFSANELAHELGLSSVATTKKFMGYLREPYLFYYLPRYNNKLKLMKKAPQKVYVVDNGFVEAKAFSVSENLGRLLENQVFIELVRRGYDTDKSLFYYRSRNDKEVDFVTRKGVRVEMLIQVCYDLSSERTLKREVDSLIECAEELKCRQLLIITRNEARMIEKNGYEIRVVPIKEF